VVLHPSAWWQHAIGAVLSERRDLLHQEPGPKLDAHQQWHFRQQYTAAYLGLQKSKGSALTPFGRELWRALDALKVWAVADIPYLPGDLWIQFLRLAGITLHQAQGLFRGQRLSKELGNIFQLRRMRRRCRVRRSPALFLLLDFITPPLLVGALAMSALASPRCSSAPTHFANCPVNVFL